MPLPSHRRIRELTSKSNGDNTFILFDDFNNANIDLTKWSIFNSGTGSTITQQNGILLISGGSNDYRGIISKNSISTSNDMIIETKLWVQTGTTSNDGDPMCGFNSQNTSLNNHYCATHDDEKTIWSIWIYDGTSYFSTFDTTYSSKGIWSVMRAWRTGNTVYSKVTKNDGSNITGSSSYSGSLNMDTLKYPYLFANNLNLDVKYDYVYVYKHTSPEPIISISDEPPSINIGVTFQILNAKTGEVITTVSDNHDLSNLIVKSIKLKAKLYSNGYGSVILHDWGVYWNTIPQIVNVMSNENKVKRNQSMFIMLDAIDYEEIEETLNIIAEYKSPVDNDWQNKFLSKPTYFSDHWELTFLPSKIAKPGTYLFRFTCGDSWNDFGVFQDSFDIEVQNNKPEKPEFIITPNKPKTSDDLQIEILLVKDVETVKEELEYWYCWYNDDIFLPEFENQTKISNEATAKGQEWCCELTLFDGVDFSEPKRIFVSIENSPPFVRQPLDVLILKEDKIDNSTIDLTKTFNDPDNDDLYFTSSDDNNINFQIDQTTGKVDVIPKTDWFGQTEIQFSANDSESEVSETLKIIVMAQNDPPILIRAGPVEVKPSDKSLNFSVYENSWINLTLIAQDVDDDNVYFNTNRTDYLGIDDIREMKLEGNVISFRPDNSFVGLVPVNLSLSDSNGSFTYFELIIHVLNVNNPPTVNIIYPSTGMHFEVGEEIDFRCEYSDLDFEIPNSSEKLVFTWTTNMELEPLGVGEHIFNLTAIKLKSGKHEIIVSVKDEYGSISKDNITIEVNEKEEIEVRKSSNEFTNIILLLFIVIIIIVVLFVSIIILKQKKILPTKVEVLTSEVKTEELPGTVVTKPGIISAPTITVESLSGPKPQEQLINGKTIDVTAEPHPQPSRPKEVYYGKSYTKPLSTERPIPSATKPPEISRPQQLGPSPEVLKEKKE
jgi:heme/copper-type cytochrome/quinol oxidase subunit 2